MAGWPDSHRVSSPDSKANPRVSRDSAAPDRLSGADPFAVSLGAFVDLFLVDKSAESASQRTIEWYRYINGRAVRRFGADRPLDRVGAPELRAWLRRAIPTIAASSEEERGDDEDRGPEALGEADRGEHRLEHTPSYFTAPVAHVGRVYRRRRARRRSRAVTVSCRR